MFQAYIAISITTVYRGRSSLYAPQFGHCATSKLSLQYHIFRRLVASKIRWINKLRVSTEFDTHWAPS